jgi:hypothetical protein
MLNAQRLIATIFAGSFALVVLSYASVALADQFVIIDQTWNHTPDLADSHKHFSPSASTPPNWVSPVDYSHGTAYVYMEVHTKPTAQPTKFQVCFEATPTYACTDQSPTYTTIGTYQWSTPFSNFYQPQGTTVDWTKGDSMVACILKDTMNNKPSADNVGATEAALYTPTEVRMVVTIVTPGGTYVPPTPTGEGGAGGMGATASSSTGANMSSSNAGTSTVTTDAGVTSASGSGSGSGGSNNQSSDSSSCSIGSNSGSELNALPAVFIAALWLNRRRARSPR